MSQKEAKKFFRVSTFQFAVMTPKNVVTSSLIACRLWQFLVFILPDPELQRPPAVANHVS
jgi:hypothetical protein